MDTPLVTLFLLHSAGRRGPEPVDEAALARSLAEIFVEARAAWPEIDVPSMAFIPHLARRWSPVDVIARQGPRGALRVGELYLACACALGNERAIAIFEERYIGAVDRAVARLKLPDWALDETKQRLRARLLLPSEGMAGGRIADYTGQGDLFAWVRVAAIRVALRVVERSQGRVERDSAVLRAVVAPGEDLELEYLKRRHAADLERALREALGALPVRERNMMRYYYAKNAGIDGVAALYRVHRATAARRIRRTTEQLLANTRGILASKLKADRREISSMLRLLGSRINTVFHRVLATAP
jgi:RNA polymerase sigma-70 factor (ECF subfamily)